MKPLKHLLLLSLFMGSSIQGNAQEIQLGWRLGTHLSILKGDYGFVKSRYLDYSTWQNDFTSYGLFINRSWTERLLTQIEVNHRYKEMYFHSESGVCCGDEYGRAKFTYLEVPLLVKYRLGKRRFKGFTNLGPVLNFRTAGGHLNRTVWSSARPFSPYTYYYTNVKSHFHPFTLGILGGIGFEWAIHPKFVVLGEARTTYDLTNTTQKKTYQNPKYSYLD